MFSSIRGRLWLSYAALIVGALAILSAVLAVFLLRNPFIYRQTLVRLQAAENLLLRGPRAAGKIDLIAQALDVRVLIFSPTGELISDTSADEGALRSPVPDRRTRRVEAIKDANGAAWLHSRTRLPDGNWLVVATPRPRLLPVLDVLRDELWRPMSQGALMALFLALILAYLLARWIADPLQQLVGAARSVAATTSKASRARWTDGERPESRQTEYARERGPQEVRELTRAFNAMLRRVEASQESQKEFVANVSHELKTPLTSIQGFSQAIMDGTADSPEARHQAAEVIHDEAARMHRMAVDLLELARLDAGTAELGNAPVELGVLLAGVQERLRPIAVSSGVTMEFLLADDLPAVAGDGDRLAQVFTNLLENALKFTPRGGRVSVSAQRDQGEVLITIADTGRGISPDDTPRIFDRFYQADSARRGGKGHGAGLGLAIAREITEAHGGRISVRSALGQGTEFVVHLPPLEGRRDERGAA
ncbi:MAG: HAMP domain-containing sensor histidine kinase [Chloroflexota bacterium]